MARQEALDTREEELLRRDLALDAREERLRARERVTADAEAAAKRDVARAVEALGGAQARVAEAEGRLRDVARREAACAAAETRARAEGERARGLLREAAQVGGGWGVSVGMCGVRLGWAASLIRHTTPFNTTGYTWFVSATSHCIYHTNSPPILKPLFPFRSATRPCPWPSHWRERRGQWQSSRRR